jgi:PA-IL-like protein
MSRRFISAVALVAGLGMYALAAEQATFILNNGERRTGELSASGPNAANFVNGQLTLNGQPVPLEQVAVIDMTGGGTPPSIELSRVPPTGGQAVVMKSGHAEGGKFVNIVRGDTLLWQDHNGQEQQYPLRDVTRIYLNSTNAHAAYRAPATSSPASTPAPVGTSGQAAPATAGTRVNANQWTDTGITVKAGDMVSFQASGQINFGQSPGQQAGPDGNPAAHSPNYPIPSLNVGTLIGKVGSSAPFGIGTNTAPVKMPASGKLLLGVNDNELKDNSGYFTVTITKQ